MLSLSVLLNTQDKAIYVILVVTLSVAFTNVGSSGQSGVGQRATGIVYNTQTC